MRIHRLEVTQHSPKGFTKLHAFFWGHGKGLMIHSKKGVVTNGAGTSVSLGHHAKGAQLQLQFVEDKTRGQ
jgi:hypothetical protein